jgi:hypothetical protein
VVVSYLRPAPALKMGASHRAAFTARQQTSTRGVNLKEEVLLIKLDQNSFAREVRKVYIFMSTED